MVLANYVQVFHGVAFEWTICDCCERGKTACASMNNSASWHRKCATVRVPVKVQNRHVRLCGKGEQRLLIRCSVMVVRPIIQRDTLTEVNYALSFQALGAFALSQTEGTDCLPM